MKKNFLLVFLFFNAALFSQNTWVAKASFPGFGKDYPAGFAIGNKSYWGTGASITVYTDDFWEFDPTLNTWTQKANFPGGVRWIAAGFAINGKGYMGTGFNQLLQAVSDFWEYDPVANTWVQKASLPSTPRASAVSFSIADRGYIGMGLTTSFTVINDFWEYNPQTDSWTQKASLPGPARSEAMGFAIGNKGYIGTGYDGVGYLSDFYEWDQLTNTWTQKANFPDGRVDDVGCSIGCKGYLAAGESFATGTYVNDLWEYDPAADVWTIKVPFSSILRDEAYAMTVGCKGYIGFGQDVNGPYLTDMWEYTPDSATQACCSTQVVIPAPIPESSNLSIPNVFTPDADGINDLFLISYSDITTFTCTIYDRWGIEIYQWADITKGWDGKYRNGKLCTDGAYYYIVEAKGIDGVNYKKAGFITLLR